MEELNYDLTMAKTSANPTASFGSEMTLRVVLPCGARAFLLSWPVEGCRLGCLWGEGRLWVRWSSLAKGNSQTGMKLRVIGY